jgi:glycosyltransferase involved in cell wall biosynthesis
MNVLHIIDSLGMGGAQTVVKGIFEKQKENENIFLFALRQREITTEVDHKNVIIYNSKLRYSLSPVSTLKKVIKEEDIDILYCHLLRSQVFGLVLKKLFFPKIRLVFHEHGEIFRKKPQFILFLKLHHKTVDLFIAVSEATKQRLIEDAAIPEEKIKVLYNFVDLKKFNPGGLEKDNRDEQRVKLGIENDCFVVGFAGRLSDVKGCDILIKSVPYIDIPNFKLFIAGDGTRRSMLGELVEDLNLTSKIIFLGYVKDIVEFYTAMDCLVVPSRSESFGLSVVEAQACGVPVIASDILSLNEIIIDGKTGLLFEPCNKQDLAEKIMLIYTDNTLRENMVKSALMSVQKYSLATYLTNSEGIYRGLVK